MFGMFNDWKAWTFHGCIFDFTVLFKQTQKNVNCCSNTEVPEYAMSWNPNESIISSDTGFTPSWWKYESHWMLVDEIYKSNNDLEKKQIIDHSGHSFIQLH